MPSSSFQSSPARLFRAFTPRRRDSSSSRPSSSESSSQQSSSSRMTTMAGSPSRHYPISPQSPSAGMPTWSGSRDRSPSSASTLSAYSIRAQSMAHLEEERRAFPSELGILEPRPVMYWESLESRVGC